MVIAAAKESVMVNRADDKNVIFGIAGSVKFEPVFNSEKDYQDFRTSFREQVKPELDRLQEARCRSEEKARRHWLNLRADNYNDEKGTASGN